MNGRVAAVLVITALLSAGLYHSQTRQQPFHVSGFIEADEIRLGSRIGGRVKEVHVSEGRSVQRGAHLLDLEPYDLLERRAEAAAFLQQRRSVLDRLQAGFRPEEIGQAKARMEQTQARLDKLRNGPRQQEIDAAAAQLELADAELARARNRYRRAEALFARDAGTKDQLDEVETELKTSTAAVSVRREQLGVLTAGSRPEDVAEAQAALSEAEQAWKLQSAGFRSEEIAAATAEVAAVQATLEAIDRQIAELIIAAPVDGIVDAIDLQPGDLISPNAPAIALIDLSHLWVRAYVPENRLNIALEQPVTVTVDSFPQQPFAARITFISRQAEFTPGNVQTPEDRSRQVFRIKVTLTSGLDVLRPGMAADIWFDPPQDGHSPRN